MNCDAFADIARRRRTMININLRFNDYMVILKTNLS